MSSELGINAREVSRQDINQELMRLGLNHINGILTGFNEAGPDPFETNKVLKFPSDRVAMLDDINEEMRSQISNFVELSIGADQGQTINSIIQRNKMDCTILELLENDWNIEDIRDLAGGPGRWQRNMLALKTMSLDDSFLGGNQSPFGRVPSIGVTLNDRVVRNVPEVIYRNPFRAIDLVTEPSL